MTFDQIRSSVFPPAKQWAYLERARTLRLASLNADGSIHLAPMWFVVEHERLFVVVDSREHLDNIEEHRTLTALVDDGEDYRSLRGISFHGHASAVTDPGLLQRLPMLALDKYFHRGHPHAESWVEYGQWAGRRYLEIVPAEVQGWDAREETHPQGRERRSFPLVPADRLYDRG